MKLLFDENLSPHLPRLLADRFPGSLHVRDCGLKDCPDLDVWNFARSEGFTLLSKDNDFYQRILLVGPPPKLVWLGLGNCSRKKLLEVVVKHETEILALPESPESVLLLM